MSQHDEERAMERLGDRSRASSDRRTETWAAADIERMRRVLNIIANIPGAREWMGTILHDAALELGAKQ